MTTAQQTWTRHSRELAGIQTSLVSGGRGEPLLVLHDETGHPGWLRWHERLAEDFTLHIPMMPGYGGSARLEWAMNMRDMAGWYLEALDDMDVGRVSVVGFSLGGWLAAELATMNPERFNKLALVGAAGVRPPVGEIMDMFLITTPVLLRASVADADSVAEFAEICPEEPTPEQMGGLGRRAGGGVYAELASVYAQPDAAAIAAPLEASAYAGGVGARRRDNPSERGAALSRVHPRLATGDSGRLRPPPGDRTPGRVRGIAGGFPERVTGCKSSAAALVEN